MALAKAARANHLHSVGRMQRLLEVNQWKWGIMGDLQIDDCELFNQISMIIKWLSQILTLRHWNTLMFSKKGKQMIYHGHVDSAPPAWTNLDLRNSGAATIPGSQDCLRAANPQRLETLQTRFGWNSPI